ncbi:BA75_02794T0 [Komagataella pastoris]|uniref:BA75_02794T0 n=1 Tax=Komagataella pastoris TaxID=4922 RepID=A0A1B2JAV4_PICPA|nr:BA75_02794T0 [Komagataella pastoris]
MNEIISDENLNKLNTEFEVLYLLYHRNSNQHKTAAWWSNFNLLLRKLRCILTLSLDVQDLSKKTKLANKEELIREKLYTIVQISQYLASKTIASSYRQFYSVIALGQFITLGFTLIGLLARVYCVLLSIRGVEGNVGFEKEIKMHVDNGDIIVHTQDLNLQEPVAFDTLNEIKPKRTFKQEKRKKRKNAIDDIFG